MEVVRWAILATALPQAPQSLLEQILTDGDLDVLGRADFMLRNNELRCELACFGKDFTDQDWYSGQIKFVEAHTYFTASARALRHTGQLENINIMKNRLKEFPSTT